jgi:hypothetical protein
MVVVDLVQAETLPRNQNAAATPKPLFTHDTFSAARLFGPMHLLSKRYNPNNRRLSAIRAISSSKPPSKAPNPLALVGIAAAAFGAFAYTVNSRQESHPASKQPKQRANPLIPPTAKDQ